MEIDREEEKRSREKKTNPAAAGKGIEQRKGGRNPLLLLHLLRPSVRPLTPFLPSPVNHPRHNISIHLPLSPSILCAVRSRPASTSRVEWEITTRDRRKTASLRSRVSTGVSKGEEKIKDLRSSESVEKCVFHCFLPLSLHRLSSIVRGELD